MKTYRIPVTWEVYGEMHIEAETLEAAVAAAEADHPYPSIDGNVDASLEVDYDIAQELNGGEKLEDEPPQ